MAFQYRVKLISVFLLLLACSVTAETIQVGRYESSSWGFSTNSWWIEGPLGLVLVNTQFLPSATQEAVEVAENYTGKKVVLAIVLHANPDKFNGTDYLTRRGIRVVSSQQVVERIPEVDALRRSWFYDRYQPDYPSELVLPMSIGNQSKTLEAAGLKIKVHIIGASVSKDHILIEVGEHLFAGDILANKHHSWLELGLVDRWLGVLRYIENLHPKYLYPGRGYASGIQLLSQQTRYLNDVKRIVHKYKVGTGLTHAIKAQIIDEITAIYPDYGNSFFLNLGIEPVWEHIDGEQQ